MPDAKHRIFTEVRRLQSHRLQHSRYKFHARRGVSVPQNRPGLYSRRLSNGYVRQTYREHDISHGLHFRYDPLRRVPLPPDRLSLLQAFDPRRIEALSPDSPEKIIAGVTATYVYRHLGISNRRPSSARNVSGNTDLASSSSGAGSLYRAEK